MIPADSPLWLVARQGCLTASRMADATAKLKNGKSAAVREQLMRDIISERLTGQMTSHFTNAAMQWGVDTQPLAAESYQIETGNVLGPEVLYPHPRIKFFAATPDATVGDEGLVEIKCPTSSTFVSWLLEGGIPEQHVPQMLAQIACTGRQWVDFVAFDPRMPENLQLMIRRFTPSAEQIDACERDAAAFLTEVQQMYDRLMVTA
jgi:putative phage-type endonuclease